MYLLADQKPENYERPQNFEDGDFQVMNLATEQNFDTVHKQFKISMCSYEGIGFKNWLILYRTSVSVWVVNNI